MRALIPFKKENAKSRLSAVLTQSEREEFVELMLLDVINTLNSANINQIDILSTSEYDSITNMNLNYLIDSADLNQGINNYLNMIKEPVLIIMADVPLVKVEHIENIISSKEDVVIVPGRGGGTNVLFIKNPDMFKVCYYGMSFKNHCSVVNNTCQSLRIYDSFLLSTDIDEPQDIVEILLHGHGHSFEYANNKFKLEAGRARLKLINI